VVVKRRCAAEIWVFTPCRNSGSGEVGEAVLRGLLAESAKEQDSARRRGKWLSPEGRTVGGEGWCAVVGRAGLSRRIVSEDEGANGAVLFGPRNRVSNKGELCAKGRQVVFPGGRSVVSRAPVSCCWKSGAVALDRGQERRSEWSCVEGHRSGV
jgi:hypothetical protein